MIEYDSFGRMKYNPEFHPNQGKYWTYEEEEYLIKWYDLIGMEEMSFALGRTEATISEKVTRLRKLDRMVKPIKKNYARRILKEEDGRAIVGY